MSTPPPSVAPSAREPEPADKEGLSEGQLRVYLIIGGIVAVIIVALLVVAAVFLVRNPTEAAAFRDVFIIFMALEFMLIGAALVVLIIQLAVLTTTLRHEIMPILESTNETVSTVRGTTLFLSENLVEPVIKLNSYLAAIAQVVDVLGTIGRVGRRK